MVGVVLETYNPPTLNILCLHDRNIVLLYTRQLSNSANRSAQVKYTSTSYGKPGKRFTAMYEQTLT